MIGCNDDDAAGAESGPPQRLQAGLLGLFPAPAADADVDAAIARQARLHLNRIQRRPLRVRRWTVVGAAAAAVIALLVVPPLRREDKQGPRRIWAREDVNHDGRVDIRDALLLARRIESQAADASSMDFTGDRVSDRRDVDYLALAAVRLDRQDVR